MTERISERPANTEETASAAEGALRCVSCARPVEASRCSWCGVAAVAGGFRVEAVLAQGPYGRVYRAVNASGMRVALKELQFAAVPEARQIEAFEREASTLQRLAHPAIPRFVAHFQEGDGVQLRLYLASAFIEGESLAARLSRGPMAEAELRRVAKEVLAVLVHLHGQHPPLLHRDLKPENLLLRPDGSLAVVDFGSARELAAGARTHRSTLVGTFGYMPPEQLGGTVDATSDLYALGATLLHAATGKPPSELLGKDLELQLPASVPAGLREILSRMVERRVDRRFPSAAAVLQALDAPARAARSTAVSPGFVRALAALAMISSLGAAALTIGAGWSERAPAAGPIAPRTDAQGWFARAKSSCNPVEVAQLMSRSPPPAGWEGSGYGAGCYALAGKSDSARQLLFGAQPAERYRAAGIVFDLGHHIADAGDDVASGPIMDLVLEFWPNHFQALYHAGMSDYALGRTETAASRLREFLTLYANEDGFRQNARRVLERIAHGEGANGEHPGAH